ncbi:hypothetical protein [Achromobacter spanius]|uniref:hypothetical protein n=1 Tax=Achromobacter spanius TaxID=217203 RepID=UPI00382B1720
MQAQIQTESLIANFYRYTSYSGLVGAFLKRGIKAYAKRIRNAQDSELAGVVGDESVACWKTIAADFDKRIESASVRGVAMDGLFFADLCERSANVNEARRFLLRAIRGYSSLVSARDLDTIAASLHGIPAASWKGLASELLNTVEHVSAFARVSTRTQRKPRNVH